MFKAIHTSRGYLGGYEFRATSDGANVRLQSRHHSKSAWKTDAQITRAEFDDEADERQIYSLYGGDSPTHVYGMIRNATAET